MLKKLNHYVPKGYLRGWEIQEPKFRHYEVFDLSSQKVIKPDRDRSFAAENDLYILDKNGYRINHYEDFFQRGEKILGLFREAILKNVKFKISRDIWIDLLEGVVSLQFRCPRSVKLYKKVIEVLNPDFDEQQNKKAAMDLMLDNIASSVDKYKNSKMVIFICGKNDDVITCETPLFNVAISKFKDNILYMPITSNSFLMMGDIDTYISPFFKNKDLPTPKAKSISFIHAENESSNLVSAFNKFTIARARRWIVFSPVNSKKENILLELEKKKISEREALDRVIIKIGDKEIAIPLNEIDSDE